jgi:DNA-binding NtrC family response regulator
MKNHSNWQEGSLARKQEHPRPWKIVIIDDDPDFRNLMESVTPPGFVTITAFEALRTIPSLKQLKTVDAIILDYYLEDINGVQISQYIGSLFPKIPVLLISGGFLHDDNEEWPDCIKGFIPKSIGPIGILNETLKVIKNLY